MTQVGPPPPRTGGGRNAQKKNEDSLARAKEAEQQARLALKNIKRIPYNNRGPDYLEQLKRQEGILKRAIAAQRKSANHSRKAKQGTR